MRRNFTWARGGWVSALLLSFIFPAVSGSRARAFAVTPQDSSLAVTVKPSPDSFQAQQTHSIAGILRVMVTDAQEHSIKDAKCSLLRANEPTIVVATATSNDDGIATFTGIKPGVYSLRVENSGFEPFNRKDVVISQNTVAEIRAVLAIASVTEK